MQDLYQDSGSRVCRIYTRILVAESAGFIQDSGSRVCSFTAANYRAALLVAGDVSPAEGPSGHIGKISDMCNFRLPPRFRSF